MPHRCSFRRNFLPASRPLAAASGRSRMSATVRARGRGAGPRAGEGGLMSETTDVVDAQIEAFRARDVERFLSHYADGASVVPFDGTPMFAGRQAMREQY